GRGRVRSGGIADDGGGFVAAGCAALAGAVPVFRRDVRWSGLADAMRSRSVAATARGLAIAAPLVVVFGGLFVAADAVFQGYVTGALPDPSDAVVRIGLVLAWGWLSVGLLRDLAAVREDRRVLSAAAVASRPPRAALGAI